MNRSASSCAFSSVSRPMNAADTRFARSSRSRSDGFWLAISTRVLCFRLSRPARSMNRRPVVKADRAQASSMNIPFRACRSPMYIARWASQAAR